MASIVLNPGLPPALGVPVSFTTEGYPKKVKGTLQRIEVLAYDLITGALIYGECGAAADSFLLGGGWSLWKQQGGPAHCVANAFYFDNSGKIQQYVQIASTQFEAAG